MSGTTVLIVDDSPDLWQLVSLLGKRHSVEYSRAADADSAWEMLAESALPDLVLLDVNLPGKDGPTLCRILRADSRTASLGVVGFLHRSLEDDLVRVLEAGADGAVFKDLLVDGSAWRERIEMLCARFSMSRRLTRGVESDVPVNLTELGSTIDQLGRCRALRGLSRPLFECLLERAKTRFVMSESETTTADPDTLARRKRFLDCLVEEVWHVLGDEDAMLLRETRDSLLG